MAISTKVLVGSAAGLAALALVGTGAGATFTDATHSVQTVKAGTLNMTLSGSGVLSNDQKTLTFGDTAPTGSVFDTTPQDVTIHNSGNIPASEVFISASDVNPGGANDLALRNGMNLCIYSPPSVNGGPGGVVFNGPLTTLESLGGGQGQQIAGNVPPGQTDAYTAEFYAGKDSSKCGTGVYGGTYKQPASLTQDAQGGSVTPSITVSYTG
jgi:hypothetical protein